MTLSRGLWTFLVFEKCTIIGSIPVSVCTADLGAKSALSSIVRAQSLSVAVREKWKFTYTSTERTAVMKYDD